MAGVVATAAMSVVMLAAKRVGLTGQLPPERIGDEVLETLTDQPSKQSRESAASLLHFAFGAAAGAVLGALVGRRRSGMVTMAIGVAYASAVWAVSYLGWVPALNLMPPATRDRPGRAWVMLAAHWVYGAVAAAVIHALARRHATSREAPY